MVILSGCLNFFKIECDLMKTCSKENASVTGCKVRHDDQYQDFLRSISSGFVMNSSGPLFKTDAVGVWKAFLDEFPDDWRQYFNCSACRKFVEAYGDLVSIDINGNITPVVWCASDVPGLYSKSVATAFKLVSGSKVSGVFYSSKDVWGTPVTGEWSHMHIKPTKQLIWRDIVKSAGQGMAEKREDYIMLKRALSEIPVNIVEQAVQILKSDSMYRGDRILGVGEWFLSLMVSLGGIKNKKLYDNLIWKFVATAPAGFCHIRSTMIGTLFEDLESGLSFESVAARFREKMNPLQYQRPQELPRAGTIKAAEKLVEKLGVAGSLERRYARLDELETIWMPKKKASGKSSGGVFSGVKAKGTVTASNIKIPPTNISFSKFRASVLSDAESILYTPDAYGDYVAFLTAVNPDSPPILQWDNEDSRNPVSWYRYYSKSLSSRWNLSSNSQYEVQAIVLQPSMWRGGCAHQGNGAVFVLKGCYDTCGCSGMCLFPEILRSEFHGIRAVIEEYSKKHEPSGREESACGIGIGSNFTDGIFQVTMHGVTSCYRIDRWD